MTATIIDGKQVAAITREGIASQIKARLAKHLPAPQLDVILVGDNPASAAYIRTKQKSCEEVGMRSQLHKLPTETTQQQLEALIDRCNANNDCHGILLQLPIPDHLDSAPLLERIAVHKDVDGFHPYNMGRLAQGRPQLCPCTPHGVMTLLKHYKIDPMGMDAVVVGASNIVGRPMALELLAAKATVTICHSKTKDLADKVKSADLLIAGVGNPTVIDANWIKPGAVVIDVGFNRLADGTICGDIDFAIAKERAGYITPVPGGVGPMTVATLLENTMQAQQ